MGARIRIVAGRVTLEAVLRDDTPGAAALLDALPFESRASTWGEEVYFEAPFSLDLEPDARQIVEPGTVCFWTEGSSIALPYGRTPISGADGKPKLAARCNLLGQLIGD
ncbi:MAG: hypothetical protein A3F77_13690, partial [Betaproteobacteria bacterium RIFCSPLOWO2_12_FULL_67_28]